MKESGKQEGLWEVRRKEGRVGTAWAAKELPEHGPGPGLLPCYFETHVYFDDLTWN